MLARSNSSKKDVHVVWDEDNLKANEEIQKDYSAVRIQEPKTPYRPPLPSDSLEDDMKPLQLDEASVADAFSNERMTAFDYVMSNGGASYDGAGPSAQQQEQAQTAAAATPSNPSTEADADELMQDAVGDKRCEPCTSFTSSGSEGSGDKRRRFELMRREHYNMKDALLKAKQLMASEDGEDGADPELQGEPYHEDEEDDTAGWHSSNGTSTAAGSSHDADGAGGQQQRQRQRHVQLEQDEQERQTAGEAGSNRVQQAGDGSIQ